MPEGRYGGGVIVLGMHRSGTSAVTELLEALGFHVGAAEELKGKSWQNPHGFFERRDVRGICDILLSAAKADWWKIRAFEVGAIPELVIAEQHAAIRELAAKLGRSGRWALKEPRLCFLLPVFLRVIDATRIILVHRNPLEVAKSLRRRNAIPVEVGLGLWEAYNLAALRNSRGLHPIVLDYDDLVGRSREVAALLGDRLLAPEDRASVDAGRAAMVIDPDLHRETAGEDELEVYLSPAHAALWALLKNGGGIEPQLSAKAVSVLAEFEEDETRRRETETKLRALLIDLEHHDNDLKVQRDRNAKLRSRVDQLEKAVPLAADRDELLRRIDLLGSFAAAREAGWQARPRGRGQVLSSAGWRGYAGGRRRRPARKGSASGPNRQTCLLAGCRRHGRRRSARARGRSGALLFSPPRPERMRRS